MKEEYISIETLRVYSEIEKENKELQQEIEKIKKELENLEKLNNANYQSFIEVNDIVNELESLIYENENYLSDGFINSFCKIIEKKGDKE